MLQVVNDVVLRLQLKVWLQGDQIWPNFDNFVKYTKSFWPFIDGLLVLGNTFNLLKLMLFGQYSWLQMAEY